MDFQRRVSVIIPCKDMASTLERAVVSALPEASEVLIIDDASTDSTARVAWQLASKHTKVRFVETASLVPLGVVAARNLGISMARYQLLLPLDADDEFVEGGITALADAYEPGMFVYGDWYEGDEYHHAPPIGMINIKNVAQATWLFSRTDWLAVGGYPSKYAIGAEDYAFLLSLLEAHNRAKYVPKPIYRYNRNPNGRAAFCQRHWPQIKAFLQDDYGSIMLSTLAK